jgi:hypothetical protein
MGHILFLRRRRKMVKIKNSLCNNSKKRAGIKEANRNYRRKAD